MKNNTRKLTAILLALAVMIPMMILPSSAARASDSLSKDVIALFGHQRSVYFTPDTSGVYEIYTTAPRGFFGRLINFFTFRNSDPVVDIYEDDYYLAGIDDTFSDEMYEYSYFDEEIGEEIFYMEPDWLGSDADGFAYLEAGVKYKLCCYNFNDRTSAFCVNVEYIGDATIRFTTPDKTVYSIDAGEAFYDEEYESFYADIYQKDFFFDITLDNGRHFTANGEDLYYWIGDFSYSWNEDLGESYVDFYLLGQYFTFDYTITE